MICVRLALALSVLTLFGAGIVSLVSGKDRRPGRFEFLSLAYVFGYGLVGLVSIVFMIGGGRIGPGLAAAFGIAGLLLIAWRRPRFAERRPLDRRTLLACSIIAVALAAALYGTLIRQDLGYDADIFWSVKSKSIHRHGTFYNPDFTAEVRPHMRPRYPLLTPAVHAWIYWATGSTAEAPIRIAMFFGFVASLGILGSVLRQRLPPAASAVLTGVFAFIPAVQTGDSGGAGGFCDYPMAILLLVSLLEARRWMASGDKAAALLAALALACVPLFKDEGGAMTVVAAVLLPLFGGAARGRKGAAVGFLLAVPALALFALWSLAKQSLLPPDTGITRSEGIVWSRIPEIVRLLGSHMLRFKEWTLPWPIAAAVIIAHPPRLRQPDSLLPWFGAAMLLIYAGAYLVFPGTDARSVMANMVKRPLLHLLPLFFVWTAYRIHETPGWIEAWEGSAPRPAG